MYEKDTNELENIRTDELIGSNPSIDGIYDFEFNLVCSDVERSDYVKRFANWMFACDECKKNFRKEHQLSYHNEFISGTSWDTTKSRISWLDYYKEALLRDIRDIRLKKLIK